MNGFIKGIKRRLQLDDRIMSIYFYLTYLRNMCLCKISPRKLVEYIYHKRFHKLPNLDNPNTFNEKLNWLKLYWYDERALVCSDKYSVRKYVEEKGLGELLNDLIAVYDSPDDIRVEDLPEKFVLKPTHDSGHVIICKDKAEFDLKSTQKKLKHWLRIDYQYMSGEWPYASKHKRIVCEKLLENKTVGELYDYKYFCFNGKPEVIFFCSDRAHQVKSDFYDLEWNLLPFRWYYEPSGKIFPKPDGLGTMIKYAAQLAEGFPFVRVDFYQTDEKIVFGEFTFFHGGGFWWFKPEEKDREFGDMILLPDKKNPWKQLMKTI